MVDVNRDIMVCFFDVLSDAFRAQLKNGTVGVLIRDRRTFLRFNMGDLYLRVFKGDMFEVPGVGFADMDVVVKIIRDQFGVKVKKGSIGGKPMTVYDIDVDEIREKTGVFFTL